ncbi:hypothetical protein [Celeribacter neptunius]|uniref:Uncharacterized protein n=1 Tax=Celeribacter neptunius TaxID=588602 RepID=A0A1I3JV85_9RHOB|nr:hypothetical protein [Celeribacter neptunius]SFI63928.1 hypothetical protein SAMN04487991_0471 [Celeribacter neptunius]
MLKVFAALVAPVTAPVTTAMTAALVASSLAGVPATASEPVLDSEYTPLMLVYMLLTVEKWTHDPVLIAAIRAQNAETSGLSDTDILAQDAAWRTAQSADPMIRQVLDNPAADLLRNKSAGSAGLISEVILTDARGLNVATTQMTSDYWQGDEAKHQETYGIGPGAVHIDDLAIDTSTGVFQGQGAMTVTDPETGEAIGAITVGFVPGMFWEREDERRN